MLSKNKIQYLLSLQRKKARDKEGVFIIEGDKIVREFLAAGRYGIITLIAKPEFIAGLPAASSGSINEVIPVSYEELKKVSSLKTPHNAMAVARMPDNVIDYKEVFGGLSVALDFIQDPGNLGTIIRAAAWFGIGNITCSNDCVDLYNPKVIQATMGAILNVNVMYTDLKDHLDKATRAGVPVYGALLEGNPVYTATLGNTGVILIGNESRGISAELIPFVSHRLVIPKFASQEYGIDSLNAGMAASVIFSEFARRHQYPSSR